MLRIIRSSNLKPTNPSFLSSTSRLYPSFNTTNNVVRNLVGFSFEKTPEVKNEIKKSIEDKFLKDVNVDFKNPGSTTDTQKNYLDDNQVPNVLNITSQNLKEHLKDEKILSRTLSLLEVCLITKDFTRSYQILKSLCDADLSPYQLINCVNNYFDTWINSLHKENLNEATEFIESFFDNFKVNPNGKTYAIMLRYCVDHELPFDNYLKHPIITPRSIFGNIDSIGLDNTKIILKQHPELLGSIPKIYKELLKNELQDLNDQIEPITNEQKIDQQLNKTKEYYDSLGQSDYFKKNDILPPTIEKGVQKELNPVDTFGMKSIRHALLALTSQNPQLESKLSSLLQNLNERNILMDRLDINKDLNFFSIYQRLADHPKEQALFEEALEVYNEERQKQLEARSIEASIESWKNDHANLQKLGITPIRKSLNARLWKWYNDALPLVEKEVEECKKVLKEAETTPPRTASVLNRLKYAPYILLIDAKKLLVIAILELIKLNSSGGIQDGMRIARAVISIGRAIESEFQSEQLLKSENNFFKNVAKSKSSERFQKIVRYSKKYFRSTSETTSFTEWSYDVKAKIGSILVTALMSVATIEVEGKDPISGKVVHGESPAMFHTFIFSGGNKIGVLKFHRSFIEKISDEGFNKAVNPQSLPMLIKPIKWYDWKTGGYNYSKNYLIRSKDCPEQLAYVEAASENGDLEGVYDGLNVLGVTAWTINKKILDLVTEAWNSGEEFLDIPKHEKELILPPKPDRGEDPSVKTEWQTISKQKSYEYYANRSQRCDTNYKLEIARAFVGEKFYFPHNLDFRGRAYPISPNFNHLGNDLSRGLLLFWKGKKLGESGFRWLKIHLSNLFGHDKVSLEDRVKFTENNYENIHKSAENPQAADAWWKKADKPWQALATIFELSQALKLKDPTEFISHQPVHQDGTCNGLQHYAALGGDLEGARQVNLSPSVKPMDVYSYVAGLVQARVDEDVKNGKSQAALVQHSIKRKVIKQTVMTNVYGVTYLGATQQIAKQLTDEFGKDTAYFLSKYLAVHVFASVRELFQGAHLIQDWLGECAKRIGSSVRIDLKETEIVDPKTLKLLCMTSVIWTSPLGLPIVQPYREDGKAVIKTNLQSISITDPFELNVVNARKQYTAFPPNFIHSLDASHMLLSAVECGRKELTFAAVHDSYWTHAGDVDRMNEIIRDKFIGLHQVDLVQRLKNEFEKRYQGYLLQVSICDDSEAAILVKEFKKEYLAKHGERLSMIDEIRLEKRRRALLNSRDINEVNEGLKMETTIKKVQNLEEEISKPSEASNNKGMMKILVPLRLPDVPPKGEFDVREVKDSLYFFS
ncbi:DNA-directed RNA polymerase [Ascoidea rubescens DSM 1968]|uniref:DNA-directed RNA polymerase n=1 Tax=Ascoidea rubescens DSM 1968 TaxID=1344418 RepID=A0A1D2V948_9ASCO|nr:DNA/RNA polymerase [Ascoidea rubescens DSM 1968]ODV58170.1 DNA/RNA polymerase [Ascoidea rubescens DSM 1968]